MIITEKEQKQSEKVSFKGGSGTVHFRELPVQEILGTHGRLLSTVTLAPGASVGEHRHAGDSETYIILDGTAQYRDNDNEIILHKGDCAYCADGDSHFIKNIGDTPLSFVALILYS